MGLKDRLGAAKRYLWSPLSIGLLGAGSDEVVRAGEPAKVVVELSGEDDGSIERIDVVLSLAYDTRTWPLCEVPVQIGRHELEVVVPAECPPTSRYTQYRFKGEVHRTKGTPADGVSPVRVIGHPGHAYRPDGPDAEGSAIRLDADTVNVGEMVSGHVDEPGRVAIGAVVDGVFGQEGSPNGVHRVDFKQLAEVSLGAPGRFRLEVPAGAPPTLHDLGTTYVTWEVRTANGRRRFTVLDPEGRAEVPESRSPGLLDIFW